MSWHHLSKTYSYGSYFGVFKVSFENILKNWYYHAKDQCCGMIEIVCPCSKEDLSRLVQFLYHGEIQCEDVFDSFKTQENLSKIFGFPENFDIEYQIAALLDNPTLSSIIDVALNEEFVNIGDNEILNPQSNDQDVTGELFLLCLLNLL